MAEFVLQEDVESAGQQPPAEVGRQTMAEPAEIRAAGETDHLHLMAQPLQAFDHDPVIEVAAGQGLQAAVDDQADAHQRGAR